LDAVERTLVLIKPDAVARGLVGEVLARFERKGLTIEAMHLRTLSRRSPTGTTPSTSRRRSTRR
jgi:nucleoside diphosphate kinase